MQPESALASLVFGARDPMSPVETDDDAATRAPQTEARLVVRVVDNLGQPVANARVEVTVDFTTREWFFSPAFTQETDARGLCSFPELNDAVEACFPVGERKSHLAGLVQRIGFEVHNQRHGSSNDAIQLEWPIPEPIWLDHTPVPTEPVELRLPPATWVLVEWDPVSDPDGTPTQGVCLEVDRSFGCMHGPPAKLSLEPGADRFLLGPLNFNHDLNIRLRHPNVMGEIGSIRVTSSSEDGVITRARLEHQASDFDWVLVKGRAMDQVGQPLADWDLELNKSGTQFTLAYPIHTDSEGRWAHLVSRTALARGLEVGPPHTLSVPIARDPDLLDQKVKVIDVGDVVLSIYSAERLGTAYEVASGVVVDANGHPIVGATITGELCGKMQAHDTHQDDWIHLRRVRTDADGHFSIWSWSPPTPQQHVRLKASHAEFLETKLQRVPLGTTSVRLELSPAGRVRLQVRMDAWVDDLSAVSVRLTLDDQVCLSDQVQSRLLYGPRYAEPELAEFGRSEWTFSNLAMGPAALEVFLVNDAASPDDANAARIGRASIEVLSETDLGQLDFRGQFAVCVLEVSRSDGRGLDDKSFDFFGADDQSLILRGAQTDRSGDFYLVRSIGEEDLILVDKGRRPMTDAATQAPFDGRIPADWFEVPQSGQDLTKHRILVAF